MYLLDTNVISEFRKASTGKMDARLKGWADATADIFMFLSVVTILELEVGTLQLERRDPSQGRLLRLWLDDRILASFAGRILPIDTRVAQQCARLHVPNPKSERDAMIAATALVHDMTVVTRNVADFQRTRAALFNPWLE